MDDFPQPSVLQIPSREVVAVEHPMVIKNIDNGLETFGKGKPFQRILHLNDPEGCLPLYLRHDDPMCVPILSHSSPTSNVLIKITIPKRISKRKRGSQEPYQSDMVDLSTHYASSAQLLRALRDNADQYKVEAVAEIERTHRFRGLADFHHSTTNTEFVTKLNDFMLPGEVDKMRQFKFDPSRRPTKKEELMPPPAHTNQTLPFNWGWHQNPQVSMEVDEATGEAALIHYEKKPKRPSVDYLHANVESIPQTSPYPLPEDRGTLEVIAKVAEALDERPVWTRRALGNHVGHKKLPIPIIQALPYVAYQFKGGPFRDAVIKYGVDPRTDKKYRMYQTLFFKIHEEEGKASLKQWRDVRTNVPLSKNAIRADPTTHLFDGKTLTLDGKVWQLCDITDPLLVRVINNATLRDKFDPNSDGYFNNGAWAKIHGIMKIKLIAIRAHVTLTDADLEEATKIPEIQEDNRKESRHITVPVPDVILPDKKASQSTQTVQEVESIIRPTGIKSRKKLRYLRLDKTLDLKKRPKRKYVRKKPVPPQSRPGAPGAPKKKKNIPDESVTTSISTEMNGDPSSNNDNGQAKQRESISAEYQTAEQNMEHTELGQDDDEECIEENLDEVEGLVDDDDDDQESDEESGHDDDDENDLDDEENPRRELDDGEYDSENTDVVDFATQGPL